ncbi:MAG: tetratricopeptide repeat protein [Bacteroidales bacterium]|nr:tetratricopeptide repeat protein [Bacteroidales bacterium]
MRFFPAIFLFFTLFCQFHIGLAQNSEEQMAVQYYNNREYEKAVELFEKLYDKRPDSYFYSYLLFSYVELKDFRSAERLVKKQQKKFPRLARYKVDMGYVYESNNQISKASKEYEDAIKSMPAERFYISDLANAFASRRQPEYAIQTYQQGRKLMRSPTEFTYEIAGIYERLGQIEPALEEYFKIIDNNLQDLINVQNRLQNLLLNDEDNSIYEIIRVNTLKQTQKYPDKLSFSILLLWLSVQNLDFETALFQAKAIDRRYKENGDRVFDIAKVAAHNKQWDVAIDAYQYLLAKGKDNTLYVLSQLELLKVRFAKITSSYPVQISDIKQIDKEYFKLINEIGFNPGIADIIRNHAHINAFYLNKDQLAMQMLDSLIAFPGISARDKALSKIDLADIKLFNDEVWDAALLYAQVDKDFPNDTLGHTAKFKSAKLSFYIGEFEWAKAQLDILRSATTRLIANDAMELYFTIDDNLDEEDVTNKALQMYASADLLIFKNQDEKALQTLDSIFTVGLYNSLFDEVLYKKAEIKVKQGLYNEADSLLNRMIAFYPSELYVDDAWFLRAEIQHFYLKNKTKAMEFYQELISNFPGSLLTHEARQRYRVLRGDAIN